MTEEKFYKALELHDKLEALNKLKKEWICQENRMLALSSYLEIDIECIQDELKTMLIVRYERLQKEFEQL